MTAESTTTPSPTDALTARLVRTIDAMRDSLMGWRHEVHRYPELSWQEHRTTALLLNALQDTDARITALPGSGAIVDLGSSEPTRRVALRADLDALPVDEVTGLDFASENPGVTHACGHDLHTVAVLGAGLALAEMTDEQIGRAHV